MSHHGQRKCYVWFVRIKLLTRVSYFRPKFAPTPVSRFSPWAFSVREQKTRTRAKKKSCKNYKPIDRENRDRHAFLSQQSVTTFRARVQGWRKKIDLKSQQNRGQKKGLKGQNHEPSRISRNFEKVFFRFQFLERIGFHLGRYLTSSSPIYVSPFGMFLCVASFKCNLQHHALMPLMQSCKQRLFVHFLISTKENFYADVQNG